jgi:cyclic pyranopterin phosphate synthase
MQDRFGRRINYLRVSVTDRCNLRCHYCMPGEGVSLLPHNEILSFEEIFAVVKAAVKFGINKVRLTGGEPLIRHGIIDLVAMIARLKEISDLALTTNGILLEKYAGSLRKAGLKRVNVSLDTLNPEYFSEITGGGDIRQVLSGIKAAFKAGLVPIRLNCVVDRSSEEFYAKEVSVYAEEHGYEVRFIKRMNLSTGKFWVVEGGSGGDCKKCNRLRLSSEGFLCPCLFSDLRFSVREFGPEEAIKKALKAKPEFGLSNKNTLFPRIGG